MKCRLFLSFLLVILLVGCIGKEFTLYTIQKGGLVSRLQKKNPHRPVTRVTVKKRSGTKITIIKDIL
ncbi:hypothetical protein COF82_25770 [Bacillus wiedmannii]|nr:hypothetical protein COF82_25770 [Bacillus wiedmannii]